MAVRVRVQMTETVVYSKAYTLEALAGLFQVPATLEAVQAVLDENNTSYGTVAEDDERLLDDIVQNNDELDIPERSWSISYG